MIDGTGEDITVTNNLTEDCNIPEQTRREALAMFLLEGMIPLDILGNPWIYLAILAEVAVYAVFLASTLLTKSFRIKGVLEYIANWVSMVILFTVFLSLILAVSCIF